MQPLWFYKHQHDNRVRSTQNAFSLAFAAISVNCAPSGETHNYCTPHIIKENYENFLIHRCNYILLSPVYCVWQVVKTPTIISNNPVQIISLASSNVYFRDIKSIFCIIYTQWNLFFVRTVPCNVHKCTEFTSRRLVAFVCATDNHRTISSLKGNVPVKIKHYYYRPP